MEPAREARKRKRRLEDVNHRPRPTDPKEAFPAGRGDDDDVDDAAAAAAADDAKPTTATAAAADMPSHTLPMSLQPRQRVFHLPAGCRTPGQNDGCACWWDTYPFEGTPVHLPYSYDAVRKRYALFGYFCSIECAVAFIYSSSEAPMYTFKMQEFMLMLARLYTPDGTFRGLLAADKDPAPVWQGSHFGCAPPRYLLDRFTPGGISVERFRALARENSYMVKPVNLFLATATEHCWYHPDVVETSLRERIPFLKTQPTRTTKGFSALFYRRNRGAQTAAAAAADPSPSQPAAAATRKTPAASKKSTTAPTTTATTAQSAARLTRPQPMQHRNTLERFMGGSGGGDKK